MQSRHGKPPASRTSLGGPALAGPQSSRGPPGPGGVLPQQTVEPTYWLIRATPVGLGVYGLERGINLRRQLFEAK